MKVYAPHSGSERGLTSGRTLIPGETTDLTSDEAKDPTTKRLLEEGHLIEVKDPPKKKEDKDA